MVENQIIFLLIVLFANYYLIYRKNVYVGSWFFFVIALGSRTIDETKSILFIDLMSGFFILITLLNIIYIHFWNKPKRTRGG